MYARPSWRGSTVKDSVGHLGVNVETGVRAVFVPHVLFAREAAGLLVNSHEEEEVVEDDGGRRAASS